MYHSQMNGTSKHKKGGSGAQPQILFLENNAFRYFLPFCSFATAAVYNCVYGISCVVVPGFLFSYLNSNTGWRVLNVGGRYTNGLNAGLFQFNANNASSNSNANVGARLLVSYLRAQDLPHR